MYSKRVTWKKNEEDRDRDRDRDNEGEGGEEVEGGVGGVDEDVMEETEGDEVENPQDTKVYLFWTDGQGFNPPAMHDDNDHWSIPDGLLGYLPYELDEKYSAFVLHTVLFIYYCYDSVVKKWRMCPKTVGLLKSKNIQINTGKHVPKEIIDWIKFKGMIHAGERIHSIHRDLSKKDVLPENIRKVLVRHNKYLEYESEVESSETNKLKGSDPVERSLVYPPIPPEEVHKLVSVMNAERDMDTVSKVSPVSLAGSVSFARSEDLETFIKSFPCGFFRPMKNEVLPDHFIIIQLFGVFPAHLPGRYCKWLEREEFCFLYPNGYLPMPRLWDSAWYPPVVSGLNKEIILGSMLYYFYVWDADNKRFIRNYPIVNSQVYEMKMLSEQPKDFHPHLIKYINDAEVFKMGPGDSSQESDFKDGKKGKKKKKKDKSKRNDNNKRRKKNEDDSSDSDSGSDSDCDSDSDGEPDYRNDVSCTIS